LRITAFRWVRYLRMDLQVHDQCRYEQRQDTRTGETEYLHFGEKLLNAGGSWTRKPVAYEGFARTR